MTSRLLVKRATDWDMMDCGELNSFYWPYQVKFLPLENGGEAPESLGHNKKACDHMSVAILFDYLKKNDSAWNHFNIKQKEIESYLQLDLRYRPDVNQSIGGQFLAKVNGELLRPKKKFTRVRRERQQFSQMENAASEYHSSNNNWPSQENDTQPVPPLLPFDRLCISLIAYFWHVVVLPIDCTFILPSRLTFQTTSMSRSHQINLETKEAEDPESTFHPIYRS